MILHLLRHADAENEAPSDFARNLTEKGRAQAAQVARFLQRTGIVPDIILTSPYVRALQTAQAVSEKFPVVPLIELPELGCGLSPQTALAVLRHHDALRHVLLVGHQPDLSILAGFLLSLDQSLRVAFDKASLLALELEDVVQGGGVLLSHLRVEQMAPAT